MQVGDLLTLQGGKAIADAGTVTGSCTSGGDCQAAAFALISSGSATTIKNSSGGIMIKGGDATANGSGTTAATLAGLVDNAASQLTTVMKVTGAGIQLFGGTRISTAGGAASSDATIKSGGGIELSGKVTLTGGSTGLLQSIGGTIFKLTGTAPPIQTYDGETENKAADTGFAFIVSGSPPSNLDPLLAGLLSSLDSIKQGAAKVLDADKGLLSNKPTNKNYCK